MIFKQDLELAEELVSKALVVLLNSDKHVHRSNDLPDASPDLYVFLLFLGRGHRVRKHRLRGL